MSTGGGEAGPARALVTPGRTTGPSGIGGWLLLPAFGLVFAPVPAALEMLEIAKLMTPVNWRLLTDPASQAYHPFYVWLLPAEFALNGAILVFAVAIFVLFLRKSPRTPNLICALYIVTAIVVVADTVLAAQIPGFEWDRRTFRELGRAIAGVAIWVPYFVLSRRVRNTFGVNAGLS